MLVASVFGARLPLQPSRSMLLALGVAVASSSFVPEALAQTAGACVAPARSGSAGCRKNVRRWRPRRPRMARWQYQLLKEMERPKLEKNAKGELVPVVRAAAGILWDAEKEEVVWAQAADEPRAIASITKVMTALVILDEAPDLERQVEMERSDVTHASKTKLRRGDQVSVGDLLHLLVMSSDNAAARALARTSSTGAAGFIRKMNAKARALGLTKTRYADPSGLDPGNISTAKDLAKLFAVAVGDERVRALMQTTERVVSNGRRTFPIYNTNRLLAVSDVGMQGGKTGFINDAGYCFGALVRPKGTERPLSVIVLGAKVRGGAFLETRHLVSWARQHLGSEAGATLVADAGDPSELREPALSLESLLADDDLDEAEATDEEGPSEPGPLLGGGEAAPQPEVLVEEAELEAVEGAGAPPEEVAPPSDAETAPDASEDEEEPLAAEPIRLPGLRLPP